MKIEKIIIGIISLICVGSIGVAVYFGVNKLKDEKNNSNLPVKTPDNTVDNTKEEIDISSAEIDEMIKIIDYLPYYAKSAEDINNEDLLYIGYQYGYEEYKQYLGKDIKNNILKIFNRNVVLNDIKCDYDDSIVWLKYNQNNDVYSNTDECNSEMINSRKYHQVVSSSRIGDTYNLVLNSLYTEFAGAGRTDYFYLTIDDAYNNRNDLNVDNSYMDEFDSWDIDKIFRGYKNDLKEETYTFILINGNITFDSYIIK